MPKLTKTYVEKLNTPGWYRDSEIKGFCVRVRKARDGRISRTYAVNARPKKNTNAVTVTIGTHGVITTENARIEALKILATFAQGDNPNLEIEAAKLAVRKDEEQREILSDFQRITLSDLLYEYLKTHQLRERTAKDYERLTKRCLVEWLHKPITQITRDMVQEKHLCLSADHPPQANYTMRILRALFSYAIAVYEDADGKPLLTLNPVDRLKHARLWNRVKRRQRIIKPAQLEAWYKAVKSSPRQDCSDILLVEIFTGLRHGEAVSLRWEDVDFEHGTVTARDTKNHTDHMIPMSHQLQAILEERFLVSGNQTFLFPGQGKDGHITDFREWVQWVAQESRIEFTEHDLRRTFETIAESLDISYYTLKRLLNHKTGNDPTAGYIITGAERMREAAQQIADYMSQHMGIETQAIRPTVIAIRKQA